MPDEKITSVIGQRALEDLKVLVTFGTSPFVASCSAKEGAVMMVESYPQSTVILMFCRVTKSSPSPLLRSDLTTIEKEYYALTLPTSISNLPLDEPSLISFSGSDPASALSE